MKKLTKVFAAALSLFVLSLTGCSNLVDDATIQGDTIKAKTERTLTIYATGSESNITFPDASARTILPAALDGENLHFYLWGKDKLGSNTDIEKPRKVTFYATAGSNGREGSVELDLPTSQYTLYLVATVTPVSLSDTAATDQTALKAAAALFATATADMRYNEKASFYLNPYFSSEGKGNVKLTVHTNWDIGAPYTTAGNIKFGMYKLTDDTSVGSEKALTAEEITAMNNATPGTPNFAPTGVTPGTYNFKVKFVNSAASPNKVYVWSDTIVVLPNQDTTADIVVPNVIGLLPTKPEKFTARFAEAENTYTDQYDVMFLWEDKANNEQYFKIDLMELIAADTVDSANYDTTWATCVDNSRKFETLKNDVYADHRFVSGSLNANSGDLEFRLRLGSRYLARISAYNDAGDSEPVYMDLTLDGTAISSATYSRPYAEGLVVSEIQRFPGDTINRFRVTYNLDEGRYYKATYTGSDSPWGKVTEVDSATQATQKQITTLNADKNADVRYYSQIAAGNEILNPIRVANQEASTADATPAFALYKAESEFTGWKINSTTGTTLWRINASATDAPADQHLIGLAVSSEDTSPYKTYKAYYKDPAPTAGSDPDYKYVGFENLDLFAVYGSAKVSIYNPSDYQILEGDVFVKVGDAAIADAEAAGTTPAKSSAIDDANSFSVNVNKTSGVSKVFIGVRNFKYSKVAIEVIKPAGDTITENVGSATTTEDQDRYVLVTKEPAEMTSGYYKRDGRNSYSAETTWTAGKIYYKDANTNYGTLTESAYKNFTYFELPARTQYAPGVSYLVKLKGYTDKNPMTPFTYVLTMKVIDE